VLPFAAVGTGPRTLQARRISYVGLLLTAAIALAIAFVVIQVLVSTQPSPEETASNPTPAAEVSCKYPANFWKDGSGNRRTLEELKEVERHNAEWLSSKHRQGGAADLSGADLSCLDLHDYDLREADLTGTNFSQANLSGANLTGAQGATDEQCPRNPKCMVTNLTGSQLKRARLQSADFTGAMLARSDLTLAVFNDDSQLFDADLNGVVFEPSEPPDAKQLSLADVTYPAKHLWQLTYKQDPKELTHLANQFHNDGRNEQEREIVYAIQHARTRVEINACLPWRDESTLWTGHRYVKIASNCLAASMNTLVFDLSFQYGWNPYRPLYIITAIWLFCGVLYAFIIRTRRRRSAIALVCRREYRDGRTIVRRTRIVHRLPCAVNALDSLSQTFSRELAVWRVALFFSLESALNIGFQEFQFGRWLRLLTTREYDLQAEGWARTIAGTQSLLSLLMLALAVWALFGRPFAS